MNYITTASNTRTKARNILVRFNNEYIDGVRKELWVTSPEFKKLRNVCMIDTSTFRKTREEANREVEEFEMNHHLATYDNSDMHICDKPCCVAHRQYWKDKEAANESFMRKVKKFAR